MVRFGVAGYPLAFGKTPYRRDRLKILDWLKGLGLDALELQMTYGPRTSLDMCREYRKIAADMGISLSVHASYYIVFTSKDANKLEKSGETLKRTYELCDALDANVVVLHPGPLYGDDAGEVLARFTESLGNWIQDVGPTETGLFVETAGKLGQLGSVDEILQICIAIPGVFPCIDFGHVHARTLGGLESWDAVNGLFQKLERHRRQQSSKRLHFHYTPIHYGPKGEITHKTIHDKYPPRAQMLLPSMDEDPLRSGDGFFHPRVEPIVRALRKSAFDCTVISETHNSQEEGAIALKRAFFALQQ
jgi:deoxyribonuclease-4